MQYILSTALQSLTAVATLFILTRLMGKRQVAQLSFFDYVVGISIGSITAMFALDASIGYARGFTALAIFSLFPIVLSWISQRSYEGRKFLDGVPTILIQNGVILERNLKKVRMTINDLLEQCREKNAFDVGEVEFAVLEVSGKVSVQLKGANAPVTPKDMNIPPSLKTLCPNLIVDGHVVDEHLSAAKKDRKWLIDEMHKQNANDPRDVLLGYLDMNDNLRLYMKNGVTDPKAML